MDEKVVTLTTDEVQLLVDVLENCVDKLDERVRLTSAGRSLGITDSRWQQAWDAITAKHLLRAKQSDTMLWVEKDVNRMAVRPKVANKTSKE